MPFAPVAGTRLHYEMSGRRGSPALVLSNSLGTDLGMWDAQVAALGESFCVIRYDTRGHGASEPTPGQYSIGELGSDVLALLDHLGIPRARFCGLSLGGMTGMWLGANAHDRIERLVLANTAARVAQPELYGARIAKVKADGMASISGAVLQRWFTPEFAAADPAAVARMKAMLERVPVEGYGGCCAAVRDMDQRHALPRIAAPTLVITGSQDAATPAADGQFIAAHIPGARLTELPAAHLSNIEQATAFTAAITAFLRRLTENRMDDRERHDSGMKVRRAVLGDAHVDRAEKNRNAFNEDYQNLITRYAWGEVWTRPGLPRHTRSLLTLALMVALNRGDEFRMHVRAAFNNGVTRDEIKEVLLQCAIYAGVPAANSAFHMAQEVFAEMDKAP